MDKTKTKEEIEIQNLVDKVESLLLEDKLTRSQFRKLEKSIKENYWHEDLDTDELISQLRGNYIDAFEKQELLEICDAGDYYDLLEEINELNKSKIKFNGNGTLDDEFRYELVLKLLKSTSSTLELENLLGEKVLEKLKFVVI